MVTKYPLAFCSGLWTWTFTSIWCQGYKWLEV